ncbi:MAG: hypothetical protein AAF283_04660 [Cyanobacteria bacterium P01_A01_bin.70]
MTSPADVLQAAREIRPYLSELLTHPDAEIMAQRLDLSLNTAADLEAQSTSILNVLSSAEPTREWARLYLEDRQPAAVILSIIRTYQPLPGKAGVVASPRYRCPVASCHQVWYRRQASDSIPNCPIHGVQMVRESKTAPHDSQVTPAADL